MIVPPYLQPGDLVALVATARKMSVDECAPAVAWLEAQGYRVRLGSSIGKADRQFAGTDAERLCDLQAQLDDPAVRAILCARGGYGTVRLIDGVDWSGFDAHPKWICGFSDITVLHAALQSRGYASIHSTMPVNFKDEADAQSSFNSLLQALRGDAMTYKLEHGSWRRGSRMEGPVMGGNLSVLYSLLGSSTLPDFKDQLLFLEDLDEYLYHLDRIMQALRRAGKLEGLAGLVVGGLTQMNDNAIGFGRTAEEIVFEAVAAYDYPVIFGFPAGHQPLNLAMRMGMPLHLQK